MNHTFIYIHHHVIGKNNPNAALLPPWSMEIDEEAMIRMGLTGALLSLPVSASPEVTRQINNLLAQCAAYNSTKYGMLACLPTEFVDEALKEIDYAYETLKVDGFCLPSNTKGIYIGDDRMDEILAELNRRSAVVLLHPTKPAGANESLFVKDMSIYEFPFDTTRSMMDLIYRGKVLKYPNIKWIVSHAGGTIPYIAYRLSTVAQENKASSLSSEEVLSSLKSLYYDVALSTSPSVFTTLKELVGASHILFGTDYPLRFENGVTESIEQLSSYLGFDEGEKTKLMSGTAKELFPRFR
ncbi:amidohydrolase family protein [Paenibacillus macerans]|uniref:amidohydrolase family protein n=1 Tax=Paenibacillus macerans TaxID=44252 RepID=UPI0022E367A2|nr:amidohydrolase family protein [Paenibacillus macerans]MEC0140939.1 amidohydrolase family protein [Paenibacillus macerans]